MNDSANNRQEGGNHYRRVEGEQHWDRLVRLFGLPAARTYFIGTATAYIERYQFKDGVKDLKKARHYIDKLIELEEAHTASQQLSVRPATVGFNGQELTPDQALEQLKKVIREMELGPTTAAVITAGNARKDNGQLVCGCWGEKCSGHEETPMGESS